MRAFRAVPLARIREHAANVDTCPGQRHQATFLMRARWIHRCRCDDCATDLRRADCLFRVDHWPTRWFPFRHYGLCAVLAMAAPNLSARWCLDVHQCCFLDEWLSLFFWR